MSVGSIAQDGVNISFLAIQTPSGMLNDQIMAQSEELVTPGVNGKRWRTLFHQYAPFPMRTFSEVSDYAAGVTVKRGAESLKEKNVRVIASIGTATYAYVFVHVHGAEVVIHPGPMAGAGTGSGTAHVEIVWQLEMTTETEQ